MKTPDNLPDIPKLRSTSRFKSASLQKFIQVFFLGKLHNKLLIFHLRQNAEGLSEVEAGEKHDEKQLHLVRIEPTGTPEVLYPVKHV